MSTTNQELKYLWTAFFEDGTIIKQPENDQYSKHDPSAEGNPSAFRDVLDKEEESPLVMFLLASPENNSIIGVDLRTGRFTINNVEFDAHDQNLDLSNKELKIVFFREVRRDTIMGVADWKEKEVEHYINRYFIGWQIVGEGIAQTVAVD